MSVGGSTRSTAWEVWSNCRRGAPGCGLANRAPGSGLRTPGRTLLGRGANSLSRGILAPVQVLVAEDDRDIGALIVRYLQKNSWSSHLVTSGTDALSYVRENPVDLVVLDLMLPGMSGLDVCRALRADPKTAAVPIIMVTAKGYERDRIAGLELGADDYVSKPFGPNELMARIKALVRRTNRAGGEQESL